jgi:hypothetical protein
MFATFDKETGEFLFFSPTNINPTFLYKAVGEINPFTYVWSGTYEKGSLVDLDSKEAVKLDIYNSTTIFEKEEKAALTDKIYREHKLGLHDQLNIIIDQLNEVCSSQRVHKTAKFQRMIDVLQAEREAYATRKKMFEERDDVDFVPDDMEAITERVTSQFDKLNEKIKNATSNTPGGNK